MNIETEKGIYLVQDETGISFLFDDELMKQFVQFFGKLVLFYCSDFFPLCIWYETVMTESE